MQRLFKLLGVIVVFIFGIGVGSVYSVLPMPSADQPISSVMSTTTANILIDYGATPDKKIISYPIDVTTTTTVLSALQAVGERYQVEVAATDYGPALRQLVTGIDAVANNPSTNSYWQYWVNNRYAPVGASALRLAPGDSVMWKYVTGDRVGQPE